MKIDSEKLVALVEARKPLYDYRIEDHRNRELVDSLWEEVATELNAKSSECRAKWNALRGSYVRILRETNYGRSTKRRKKWHLRDSLSFLRDLINARKAIEPPTRPQRWEIKQMKIVDQESLIKGVDISDVSTGLPQVSSPDSSPRRFTTHLVMTPLAVASQNMMPQTVEAQKTTNQTTEPSTMTSEIRLTHQNVTPQMSSPAQDVSNVSQPSSALDDADLFFFKSLMPDVKRLSMKRKRQFKEIVMCNLNRILDEEEEDSLKSS